MLCYFLLKIFLTKLIDILFKKSVSKRIMSRKQSKKARDIVFIYIKYLQHVKVRNGAKLEDLWSAMLRNIKKCVQENGIIKEGLFWLSLPIPLALLAPTLKVCPFHTQFREQSRFEADSKYLNALSHNLPPLSGEILLRYFLLFNFYFFRWSRISAIRSEFYPQLLPMVCRMCFFDSPLSWLFAK